MITETNNETESGTLQPVPSAASEAPQPAAGAGDGSEAELAALKEQLAETAKAVLADVPEHLRALIPTSLSPADQIAWFNKAKASGAFDKPKVPNTETGKPAITPKTPDTTSLPVFARLAAGYAK